MKLFLTGSTGKVGSRVARHLAEKGHELRVLVRGPSHAQDARERGWNAVQGDLSAPECLKSAIAGVDAVVHLAAFFRGATPAQIKTINEIGTVQLAQVALEATVIRFLYTSTSLVYGEGYGHASLESETAQPKSPYPQSKLAAEKALALLRDSRGLNPTILRLTFVYGNGDTHLTDWLPRLRELPGNRRLQLIHHVDVCQAIELALSSEKLKGYIYNVADDESLEVDEILLLLTGSRGKTFGPLSEHEKWEGIMDSARIREDLGFRPSFPSLRDAISEGGL